MLEDGHKRSYFAGCDYFRLSSHPALRRAFREAAELPVLSVCASRKTTGNHPLYEELEHALADFFLYPHAVLVANGYLTNLVVAQALAGEFSHALLDERAHASLVDASRFLDCPVIPFPHRNVEAATKAGRRCGPAARLILLTDGLFAHSGQVAPLDQYLLRLPASCRFLVDDAHGAGVLGRAGRGTTEYLDLRTHRIMQTITLSKAFGLFGGAVLGSAALRRRILVRSRSFAGHTPFPIPIAYAALAAVRLVRSEPRLRRQLLFKAAYVKAALRECGWPGLDAPGPIIPLHLPGRTARTDLGRKLWAAGIHAPLTQYTAEDKQAYYRFVISSEHTAEQLEELVKVLRTVAVPAQQRGARPTS